MEWVKKLLEENTKDGTVDVDAFNAAFDKAFPEHAVPKADFNKRGEELKAAREQLDGTVTKLKGLEKAGADADNLKKTITDLEGQLKAQKEEAEKASRKYALVGELTKSGVLDPDYLIYKQGGLEGFTFDSAGAPVGVSDVVKKFKEDNTYAHLFKADKPDGYDPKGGGAPTGKNPFAKDSFNLTEQGKLLREDPARAAELAKAAGITL